MNVKFTENITLIQNTKSSSIIIYNRCACIMNRYCINLIINAKLVPYKLTFEKEVMRCTYDETYMKCIAVVSTEQDGLSTPLECYKSVFVSKTHLAIPPLWRTS